MSLANSYVVVYGQLPEVFRRIAEGQAPPSFTRQYLKDIGFGGSNYRPIIPLLKTLGFLSADGTPTARYQEYRNSALAKKIMGEALTEAYSDVFTIKQKPTPADRELIEGKFMSSHNTTPHVAKLMANTFFSLLSLADLSSQDRKTMDPKPEQAKDEAESKDDSSTPKAKGQIPPPSLHYNIQIHLPATKDVEVYNSIFKALKDHLIE